MSIPSVDPAQEKQAFDTHYNYADCLSVLTNSISLSLNSKLDKVALPFLGTKNNLIGLTAKSLKDEFRIVQIDQDYSYASTSWLPIKGYYLLFNILLTIEYILTVQKNSYSLGHAECIQKFTSRLERGEILFSNPLLNQIFDGRILDLIEVTGANLSRRISIDRRFQMAMRKASLYKKDECKRKKNLNFRTARGRTKRDNYIRSFKISIFEFPYYMRIRSNYRDFAFIEGVSSSDTKKYFEAYFSFIMNLFIALEKFKNDLVGLRS